MAEKEKIFEKKEDQNIEIEQGKRRSGDLGALAEKAENLSGEVVERGIGYRQEIEKRKPESGIMEKFNEEEEKIENEAKNMVHKFDNSLRTQINSVEAGKENDFIEVNFYDKNGQKSEIQDKNKKGIEKALKIIDEENSYYRRFFKGENIVSKVEFKESEDNFFAHDEEKTIDVPLKNSETLEDTALVLRHEAFHEAMRIRKGEWEKNMKEQMADNIKEGNDTKLEALELNIETGKFKKFIEDQKNKRSILSAVDINYAKINPSTHLENDIEEIIEEKLADEMMLRREQEENPEYAVENIIKAKMISLNNIAKNEGFNSYEDIDPFKRAGFKGFIANYYNTYRFLSQISAEAGKKEESEKFALIAENGRKKMEYKISKMFENKEWEEMMKEKFGYTKQELLLEINDLLNKFG